LITDRRPKDQPRLRQADTSEKFDEFRLSHAAYQVLEQGYHWDPGSAKHADTADPLGDPLNGNEASPPSLLEIPGETAAYLEACIQESDGYAAFIAMALDDIARAKGMTQVARETGLSRESLYKVLSDDRSPSLSPS